MEFLTLITTFLFVILLGYILKPKRRPHNFPPGPKGIPLFGNAFQMGSELHRLSMDWEKIYGPIMGIQNGSYWFVILTNLEDIREAYSKLEFSGRFGYNPFLEENISSETKGVVMSSGQPWQELRRFSLKTLREFGFGKRSMESSIQEEVRELIEEKLRKNLGEPISTKGIFNASVLNVIWTLVAGERYKLNDERLQQLLTFVTELFGTSFNGLKIFNFMFPAFVKLRQLLPFHLPDSNKPRQKIMEEFLQKTIDEHKETIQLGNPRDFIDSYLEERIKSGDSSNFHFNDANLVFTLMDFFGAGSDTTSTTLQWFTFLIALHPQVQEKLFNELQTIVGNRTVQLEDRINLPYTEAVMTEVYRISSLAPIAVPHATTQDVVFKGFNIPKNTVIFGNMYAAHFSKGTWGDPENFRPERFLSKDEKTFIRHSNIVPFSVGKRQVTLIGFQCLGETLARDEFFIFLTNIVQQVKISMPEDEPKHTLKGQRGLVLTPEPHRIIFHDRNN